VSQKQSFERTSAGSGDNDERLNLKRVQHSQECISALISVQTLQTIYGLSSSNARLLLRSPMIVRFSTRSPPLITFASQPSLAFSRSVTSEVTERQVQPLTRRWY
jgi:hypothetical protein